MSTNKKERKFKPAAISSRNYKGLIEFPEEGVTLTPAEFNELYADSHVFADMKPADREAELKEAYKIATNGNTKAATTEGAKSK